jgi:hypothetical protein
MSTGKGSYTTTSFVPSSSIDTAVTDIGASVGMAATSMGAGLIGASATVAAAGALGVVLSTAGAAATFSFLAAGVVAGTTVIGATGFAAYKSAEITTRLAAEGTKILLENIDTSYRKINERNRQLIEQDIKQREEQLKAFTEAMLLDEAKTLAVLHRFLDNIDFSVLNISKEDFISSMTALSNENKMNAVKDLAYLVYQLKKMNEVLDLLYENKAIDAKAILEIQQEMEKLLASALTNPKLDMKPFSDQVQKQIERFHDTLLVAEKTAREEYVKRDLVKLRHLLEYRYVTPLLYLLKEELQSFAQDASLERKEYRIKQQILAFLTDMNKAAVNLNDLVLEDPTKLKEIHALIDTSFAMDQDVSQSLEAKFNIIQAKHKLLMEGVSQLEVSYAKLMQDKTIFEKLLMENNLYRSTLGYPTYQYAFDAEDFEMIKKTIEKENQMLKIEVEEIEIARYKRDALILALSELGYELVDTTSYETKKIYRNEVTSQMKALLHAGDGHVLEVISTTDGQLNYYLNAVDYGDGPLDVPAFLEKARLLCTQVNTINKKLSEYDVQVVEGTIFNLEPKEENIKFNNLEEYGKRTKDLLREKRKMKRKTKKKQPQQKAL